MDDVHIFCRKCGSELKFLGEGSGLKFAIVPCKKCKNEAWLSGYSLNPLWSGLLGRHRYDIWSYANGFMSQSPLVGASGPAPKTK